MKRLLIFLISTMAITAQAEDTGRFASIFTNNMVLQQSSEVNLWGYAQPNEVLAIKCSWGKSYENIMANPKGFWIIPVKTPKASLKEYSITLANSKGKLTTLNNILIGEVWLCSGQSNMEMVLMNQPDWNLIVENSEDEIAKADYPYIRMLTVGRKESFTPMNEADPKSGWVVCNPTNAKWFSAVGYFFGRELFNSLNVPIGIIVSSYGGSPIQSWLPLDVINSKEIYNDRKEKRDVELKASTQSESQYVEAMKRWIAESEKKSSANISGETATLQLPINFEKSKVGNQMGELLLTKSIEIPISSAGKGIQISLGTMDDLGRVYFNGELVWEEVRNSKSYSQVQFAIPAEKVKAGSNLIEVKVLNILWGGGLTGSADKMYYTVGNDNQKYTLTGDWTFTKIFDLWKVNPIPNEGKPLFSTAASLYNGMLYPLINYKIKGCLWYQGEENVGDPQRYPEMLSDLIKTWRSLFQEDFPFYYVQIAPYCYDGNPIDKAAEFREAQAKVEKVVPKTGMVVTIDVGNPTNIHPAKKQEVGVRLARMALSETYRQNIPCKFPEVTNSKRVADTVVLTLTNTYQGLIAKGTQHEFEVSEDGVTFYPANIKISKDQIRVSGSNVAKPSYVRYCWRNSSCGTIFNSEGLPLSSFSIKISDKISKR